MNEVPCHEDTSAKTGNIQLIYSLYQFRQNACMSPVFLLLLSAVVL